MKILHILSQRPECTGSGIYFRSVVEHCASKGHENTLLAGIPDNTSHEPETKAAEQLFSVRFEGRDLPFPVVGMSDVMPYRSQRFSSLSPHELKAYLNAFEERIYEAVSRFRPHIIHSHHLWLVTALTRRLFPHIPMVTTCHGTDLRQYVNTPHLREHIVPFVGQIECVMALSQIQAAEIHSLLNINEDKIHVVGGGFDDSRFFPGEKNVAPPVDILYAGKFSMAKGVPWLLKSLMKIPALPWRLHMAGSGTGEEMDACMALADKLGDRVVIHGRLSHHELSCLMKRCHIFVLPSFFEGLPLVLLEALASGCRVVTTSLPGSKELMKEAGDHFIRFVNLPPLETVDSPYAEDEPLLEKSLSDEISLQIKATLIHSKVDMSEVNKITAPFTWTEVFNRIESVYQKALHC